MKNKVVTRLEIREDNKLLGTVLLGREVTLGGTVHVNFDNPETQFENGEWQRPKMGVWSFKINLIKHGRNNDPNNPKIAITWWPPKEEVDESADRLIVRML